jgi:hypothetical protein
MTMNTRIYLIGAAIAAILGSMPVNAQVLGGSVGGGLGGTLNGGLHQMDVTTQGTARGSLGGHLDTDPTLRTTRDLSDRSTDRVKETTGRVRNRAEAAAERGRDASSKVANAAVTHVKDAAETQKPALSQAIDADASLESSIGGGESLNSPAPAASVEPKQQEQARDTRPTRGQER